jgi:hypothetical protein
LTSPLSGSNTNGTWGIPNNYVFHLGTTNVTYRIRDAQGNIVACNFIITVLNSLTGYITGTATASQNVATTSTITFSAGNPLNPLSNPPSGNPNFTFTYTVNGGAPQVVSTTGGQSSVTVAQSNAIIGTFQYMLLSVTDGIGCPGVIPNPTTATITVVPGAPDLTSSQFFSTTQIAPGGVIDEVIVVRNVGSAPTSGPITISFTNYSALTGLTVSQIAGGTSVMIGIDTYVISGGWTLNGAMGTLTSNNVIPPGGNNTIGLRITRGVAPNQGANGSVTQTTTVQSGTGGGETPSTNNTISNSILKN